MTREQKRFFLSVLVSLTIVLFLFPLASHSAGLKATTSLTIMDVISWQAREPGDTPISSFPVKSKLWGVTVSPSMITWQWSPGLYGLLYAFYTEDNGKTFKGWGWDYVTPLHTSKLLTNGYVSGWFGTAVGTCASCTGYPARTTVYFRNSY